MVKDTWKLDSVRKYRGVDVGDRQLVYMCICMYTATKRRCWGSRLVLHAKDYLGGLVLQGTRRLQRLRASSVLSLAATEWTHKYLAWRVVKT